MSKALNWMPYKVVGVHPEISPTCFIGSASALRINGTECIVVTRGRLDLAAVLEALTENDYDIEQRYAVCILHSDSVQVEIPETPEQLPIALPAAEQLEEQEEPPEDVITTGGVPTYKGTPVVKYLDPVAELEADTQAVQDLDADAEHAQSEADNIAAADAEAEDDDDL